jgi:P pilus assembly chaperone PapD
MQTNIKAKTMRIQPNGTAIYYPSSKNAGTDNMFTEKKPPIATTTWERDNISRLYIQHNAVVVAPPLFICLLFAI